MTDTVYEELKRLRSDLMKGRPHYELDPLANPAFGMNNMRRPPGGGVNQAMGLEERRVRGNSDPNDAAITMIMEVLVCLLDREIEKSRKS